MPSFPTPGIQRRWKALPGEPVGDAGDPYTGYDRFGRTERMRWVQPQEDSSFLPLVDVAWGYNRASQKTWRRDALAPADTGQDQHFGYDGLYQVTERQRGLLNTNTTSVGAIPAQQENFAYDQTGNWQSYRQQNDGVLGIEESRVNNRSNQITQVDGSSAGVGYDKNGNMLEVPTGEGLTGPASRLEWDAWNRLKRVFDAEDNLIAEYEYDGLGRRTTETVGGVTRHFYYDDQWRVVEERLDAATTAERQYVWHPSDRWELILRDRSTGNDGTLDERLYPLKDQLDPVALCDASGTVVERYAYSAFGLPTFLNPDFTPKEDNSSSFDWNFLFHAEFADTATGWFNYGYRYYVPALGRWLSRDPIGIAGGMNLYAYISNRINNRLDHLGLLEWSDFHGVPDPNINYDAYTRVILSVNLDGLDKTHFETKNGQCCYSIQPGGAKVTRQLDRNASWVRDGAKNNDLLHHEEGHVLIAKMIGQQWKDAVLAVKITACSETADDAKSQAQGDYLDALAKIRINYLELLDSINFLYDDETSHGSDPGGQTDWDKYLRS